MAIDSGIGWEAVVSAVLWVVICQLNVLNVEEPGLGSKLLHVPGDALAMYLTVAGLAYFPWHSLLTPCALFAEGTCSAGTPAEVNAGNAATLAGRGLTLLFTLAARKEAWKADDERRRSCR